jgi:DNA-binding response OmpR family regulator
MDSRHETQRPHVARTYAALGLAPCCSVLLAEEFHGSAAFARRALERLGSDLLAVPSVDAAVVASRSRRFDLILLDLWLPDICAVYAIRLMRLGEAHRSTDPVPIVVITTRCLTRERGRYLDAGASQVLVKPFDPACLVAFVDHATPH